MHPFSGHVIAGFLLLALCSGCGLTNAELPADVTRCRVSDVACIATSMEYVLRHYSKGNAAMRLPPIDEIEVENVTLARATTDSPIQLNMHFNAIKIYGLEKALVERVVGFDGEIAKSKFEVYVSVPEALVRGDYVASGRVLLLGLNGKGDAVLKLRDTKIGVRLKLKEVRRDGKRYLKLAKIKSTLEPAHISFQFENLIQGQQELSDNLNALLNENWQAIWAELSPGVNKALSQVVKSLLVDVLEALSYDDMLIHD